MKRILWYLTDSTPNDEYSAVFVDCMKKHFEHIYVFSEQNYADKIQEILRDEISFDYLYIIGSSYSEFISSPSELFDYMESKASAVSFCTQQELFGERDQSKIFASYIPPKYSSIFLCVPNNCINAKKLLNEIKDKGLTFFYSLCRDAQNESFFGYLKNKHGYNDFDGAVPFAYDISDYVHNLHLPVLFLDALRINRKVLIEYGCDDKLSFLYDMLSGKNGETPATLEKYIFSKCDPSQIKEKLNLNYVLGTGAKSIGKTKSKCAVFAHLYYEEGFEEKLGYLKSVEDICDIYISYSDSEKLELLKKTADKLSLNDIHFVMVKNRGRDISALLVGFAEQIKQYDYFCFIHDKKHHKGSTNTVAQAYDTLIWDSMLGSRDNVDEIISLLDGDELIGVLCPFPPYWGEYEGIISNYWTICYENTRDLAKRLGIGACIDRSFSPSALGNAFWCRRNAIAKVLEHPWDYDDFDPEPLAVDGTLSHSIERIYPYAAFDSGYLTASVIPEKYVNRYVESYRTFISLYYKQKNFFEYKKQKNKLSYTELPFEEAEPDLGIKGYFRLTIKALKLLVKSLFVFIRKRF